MIYFYSASLLVYRNVTDFYRLILFNLTLYWIHLAVLANLWWSLLGFLWHEAPCHLWRVKVWLCPCWCGWLCLISFSCLIAKPRTSSIMLNNSGDSGHPCLVPYFKVKLGCPPLSVILALGLLYMIFIMLCSLTIPTFLKVFIKNGCCTLSDFFLHILSRSHDSYPLFY